MASWNIKIIELEIANEIGLKLDSVTTSKRRHPYTLYILGRVAINIEYETVDNISRFERGRRFVWFHVLNTVLDYQLPTTNYKTFFS